MNGYEFRLHAVLRLRLSQESSAREQLHAANLRLNDSIAQRDRELERFLRLASSRGTMSGEELLTERCREELLAGIVRQLQSEVGRAAGEVVQAQLTWTSARRAVKALERLDDRRRRDHDDQSARRAAIDVDDIVGASYVRHISQGAQR